MLVKPTDSSTLVKGEENNSREYSDLKPISMNGRISHKTTRNSNSVKSLPFSIKSSNFIILASASKRVVFHQQISSQVMDWPRLTSAKDIEWQSTANQPPYSTSAFYRQVSHKIVGNLSRITLSFKRSAL